MKKIKLMGIIIIGILLIAILVFFLFFDDKIIKKENKIEEINCKTITPVYFKASEKQLAGEMSRNKNIIAVIPEENYLIARTEVLDCPNFEYSNYIKGEIDLEKDFRE